MFFLERKERYVLPNILGNRSFPVYTHRWKAVAKCEEREPLEKQADEFGISDIVQKLIGL